MLLKLLGVVWGWKGEDREEYGRLQEMGRFKARQEMVQFDGR